MQGRRKTRRRGKYARGYSEVNKTAKRAHCGDLKRENHEKNRVTMALFITFEEVKVWAEFDC